MTSKYIIISSIDKVGPASTDWFLSDQPRRLLVPSIPEQKITFMLGPRGPGPQHYIAFCKYHHCHHHHLSLSLSLSQPSSWLTLFIFRLCLLLLTPHSSLLTPSNSSLRSQLCHLARNVNTKYPETFTKGESNIFLSTSSYFKADQDM